MKAGLCPSTLSEQCSAQLPLAFCHCHPGNDADILIINISTVPGDYMNYWFQKSQDSNIIFASQCIMAAQH